MRKIFGALEDVVALVLIALCVPLVILLIGLPVALLVRLMVEIAQRL